MNCPHCQREVLEKPSDHVCPACGKDFSDGRPQKKNGGRTVLLVLLAPAVITMPVALLKSANATSAWVLISCPIAGLICGLILTRGNKSFVLRGILALLVGICLAVFCLISCFFGCGLAGGGGVRIGG
jgi:uncharacterized protein (DUF983 family)